MKKIVFIGAGSFGFTRGLVTDILTFPAFEGVELALVDIDPQRLEFSRKACEKIVAAGSYKATVSATLDRREALKGADGVLITILSGGPSIFRTDIEIPKKYGVDICVGDTRGPSGIFRFLRTAPVMLDICRDIEKLCPDAIVLNYTNPMAMLCRYLQSETKLKVTGLCHSVQGTAEMLARWIGADYENVSYLCAGINHQAFYLNFLHNGKDVYPDIAKAVQKPEIYGEEIVRCEMYKNLGYFPTESSGHNSEYNPWFRKTPKEIEKYCTHGTGWNPGGYAYILDEYFKMETTWQDEIRQWLDQKEIDLKRGSEYAAHIFNAVFGDHVPFEFNGNLRNFGLIDGLPEGCCVEVPAVACKNGILPMHVGKLPPQLNILVGNSAQCEELAVNGCIAGDREMIYHAILFDPLTTTQLDMAGTRAMVNEMFEANRSLLPQFYG
ncbi:MAG: alpha-galactosidase [Treponema sp.]|jgi:alpha-galactosidase|nr:alpha-galactosidase [Treponema sp.]